MEKQSIRQRVINLQEGESITIPVGEIGDATIRGYASELGFSLNRKYTTHRNRVDRTYTITRSA